MPDVIEAQRAFDAAELAVDTVALDGLLTDDFRSMGEQGHVLDKQQWIARHGEFTLLAADASDVDVRHYDRTAIICGRQRVQATWRGEVLTLTTRFSQVWVRPGDGWRLAAIQFSPLA